MQVKGEVANNGSGDEDRRSEEVRMVCSLAKRLGLKILTLFAREHEMMGARVGGGSHHC